MSDDKLKSLQGKIAKAKDIDWQAGATSFSTLSTTEQKQMLGLSVPEAEIKATAQAIAYVETLLGFGAPALPSSVDWRNKGGNWVTSVKDQGGCGSCVSFATCATIESHLRIACKDANMAIDLSESYEFFCGCGQCCANGWNFAPALDFAKNTGVALDKDWPYQPNNQPCKQVPIYTKIKSWSKSLSSNDRKSYLANTGPMVGGLAIYSDFYNYTSGVYKKTPGATLRGYHAVCIVGYDDAEEAWICKNSWGTNWGENGFFKIGYGQAEMDTSFAFYGVDVDCPPPPPAPVDPCRAYLPFLRRVLLLARRNPRFRACLCYYICRRSGRRPNCPASYMRVIRQVHVILRRCPQYRRPFCRALRC